MDKFQQDTHIPKDQRKTILLLSDDLRMNSGIATMSKNIVLGTCQHFNWVQLAAAINRSDSGKIFDISKDVAKETGVEDANVILYPYNGYGDSTVVRMLMMQHNVSGILHFTDPRFWIWLYQMEHEIREHLPLLFYHIWDDLPYPRYNRDYYESCDWIGCISKQTYGIVKNVWGDKKKSSWKQFEDWQVDYIPHGIDHKLFKPIDFIAEEDTLTKIKKSLFGNKEYDFVVFWNNRNIRRKMPADVIMAYKEFCDKLPKEKADKCVLLMHTATVDSNGTDLPAVVDAICPDYNVVFTKSRVDQRTLNYYYNISDVTVNIASNEGWGLSSTESMLSGTMVINNVTGGLQDQCGFTNLKGEYLTPEEYVKIGTLHDFNKYGEYKCGQWAKPIWPKTRSIVGSPPTPYIFDDRVDWSDLSDILLEVYQIPKSVRDENGLLGREFALNDGHMTMDHMSQEFIDGINKGILNFKPRKRFELYKV